MRSLLLIFCVSWLTGCTTTEVPAVWRHAPLPVEWQRPIDEACINLGADGDFDSHHLFAPKVIYDSTGQNLRMFYCGSGPGEKRLFKMGIADRSVSEDDTKWVKHANGPVLEFGDGQTSLVTPALLRGQGGFVLRDNGLIHMYIIAVNFNEDEPGHRLYETTSTDEGLTWAPLKGPLMENIYAPSVMKVGDQYRMWYVDVTTDPWCFRYAVSKDGHQWAPGYAGPVMIVDQPWERSRLFYPCVVYDGRRYLMWYGAYWKQRRGTTALGLAISEDGIHWRKYADNPIIRPDPERPFESNYCTSHSVLPRSVTLDSSVPVLSDIPIIKRGFTNRSRVCDGYQIWYATRNKDVQKHKYFAISTAVTGPCPEDKESIVPKPKFAMSAKESPDSRLEPLHYLKRYGQETEPAYAFTAKNRDEWKRWHRGLRKELARAIGMPEMDDFPLRVTKGPVDQCKGYKRLAFTIETAPGLYVPAFLLVPDELDEPRPAILCSHGHGIGMNGLVGLTEEGKERQFGQGYQHDFGTQAVRAGFVTLVFDQMGFGRRRDFEFNKKHKLWNHCEQPSKNALHHGLSMTGIRVWDAMRMIDFLESRPEVQPDKIGMVGISGGGLVTQFTAVIDDRIKAACVSGYCNRYESCILGVRHCIDNYVPGLGLLANNDDIACAIAPRPLLIESGTEDNIFPIEATRAAMRKVKRCYKLLNASDNFDADIFEAGHQFSGAKTWTFFKQHLGNPES